MDVNQTKHDNPFVIYVIRVISLHTLNQYSTINYISIKLKKIKTINMGQNLRNRGNTNVQICHGINV